MANTPKKADKPKRKPPTAAQLAALKAGRRSRKGVPNKVTVEVKLAAASIVDDPVYRKNLFMAMKDRTVAPAVEMMLWHYAKGKPKDTVSVDGNVSICWLDREPKEELAPEDGS